MMNGQLTQPLAHNQLMKEWEHHICLEIEERQALNDVRRKQQILFNEQLNKILPEPKERRQTLVFDIELDFKEAVRTWNYEEVERLLKKGASPNVPGFEGVTHLHNAAIDNDPKMAYLLCTYGADVNAPDSEMFTPLHSAACCGHDDVVNVLLEFDADLLVMEINGEIPFDVCVDETTQQLIWEAMQAKGFDEEYLEKFRSLPEKKMLADLKAWHHESHPLDVRYDDGSTFLHIAAAHGYYDVALFLLRHLSPSLKDHDNWQPLHAAANWDHVDMIELLCRYDGVDFNAQTKTGERAIDLCQDGRTRAVLLQMEEDSQSKNKKKRHPYGARDSRARIRKKKMEASATAEASPFTRGVMRRHSMRDKKGVTLARLDEKKEGRAMMRSWAGEIDLEEEEKEEKKSEKNQKKKNTKISAKKSAADQTLDESFATNKDELNTTKSSKNDDKELTLPEKKKKRFLRCCCIS